ncbi:MAG: carboxymuconolactone decarboxylase family protein [Pseudomonadota bacterium]|nr:carboxymuconolactone decarboxylase family protein [Pseudomonadota bacterium]
MTHLNPPDAAALDEVKNELDFVAAAMGFEPNSMKIMAHRPNILRGFLALMGAIIGPDALLDPGLRQMIAHIASSAAGCRYCQAHTAHGAGHAGVPQEKIEALWSYADSPLFTEAERAALSLAQAGGSVPNQAEAAHFDALKAHYTDAEMVEISAIIAAFGFLNRWNDTLATTLEDSPTAFAQASLAASGWAVGKHE